jgi:uncharacterized membrane protein
MRALILLAVFILSLPTAVALEFESYQITTEVEDLTTKEDYILTLRNTGDKELRSFFITFPLDAEVLSVRDSYGDLTYTTARDRSLTLSFDFAPSIKPGEKRLLFISIVTKSRVTWKGDYYEYLLVLTPRQDLPDFELVLKLPSGANLYAPREGFKVLVPEAQFVEGYSTPPRCWKIERKAANPEVFLVRYRAGKGSMLRTIIMALGALGALAALTLIARKALVIRQRRRALGALKILNEREKRILEEIIKNDGIKQYTLLEKLDYTKSSLSKILAKLEARGLIRKKKIGKINKWYFNKKKL